MRDDARPLVLGLDVGGTSSRALLTDSSGRVLGRGSGAGGNPNSHPPEQAVEEIAAAARAAMAGADPDSIDAAVLGMAGVSALANASVAELFQRTWSDLGLACPMRVVSDCEVAFAAGTPEPTGTVVIAGTGSIAARIERHHQTATAGGHGWLLGDEGSSFWLGREAVRGTLHALDRHERLAGLTESVVRTLLDSGEIGDPDTTRRRLIATVGGAPPIRLAEVAPLVTSAASAGDVGAEEIVRRGARLLLDTARLLRPSGETTPIVLAGSLVDADNPVGRTLRAELTERGDPAPRYAGPGAAGAAWLALHALDETVPTEVHALLTSP